MGCGCKERHEKIAAAIRAGRDKLRQIFIGEKPQAPVAGGAPIRDFDRVVHVQGSRK